MLKCKRSKIYKVKAYMDFFLFCCCLTGLPSFWRRVCGSCLPCPAANWLSMRIFHIENNFDPADRTLASQLFAQARIHLPLHPSGQSDAHPYSF